MKISFDYDDTISTQDHIRKHIRYLISKHHEVYIVTSRMHLTIPEWQRKIQNTEVFKAAEKLGIKQDHVIFTEYKDKWKVLDELGIEVHYDDSTGEHYEAIVNDCKCKIILV